MCGMWKGFLRSSCSRLFRAFSVALITLLCTTASVSASSTPTRTPTPTPSCRPPLQCNNSLLPQSTPTAFAPSRECPSDQWSASNLDFNWRAACGHCMASAPTSTAAFSSIPLPTVPAFSTVAIPTIGPSPTPWVCPTLTPTSTLTPTPVGTVSACPHARSFLGSGESPGQFWTGVENPFYPYEKNAYTGSNTFLADEAPFNGVTVLEVRATGLPSYSRLDFTYRAIQTRVTPQSPRLYSVGHNSTPNLVFSISNTASPHTSIATLPANTTGRLAIRLVVGANAANSALIEMLSITLCPSNPPTSTPFSAPFQCGPTATPVPTGTPVPTATPVRALLPLADCRVPVYADFAPAVSFDLLDDGDACYRLFPGINVDLSSVPVLSIPALQVPPIDFCFRFIAPVVSVVGVIVDLATFVSAGIALFLVRWALFN